MGNHVIVDNGNYAQLINGLRLEGPNSNIIVRSLKTGKRLELQDPHGKLIRRYRGSNGKH